MTPPEPPSSDGGIPRAEEIIAEVYRQLREKRTSGDVPGKIVMPRAYWRAIEDYRRDLGPVDGPVPDYLSDDGLFGLEIWYGNDPVISVE